MKHIPGELFYPLQSEVNILNESVNRWLSNNPYKRNAFIRQLKMLFEKKCYRHDYSFLSVAVWTGPELFRSLDLFDEPYCRGAANILYALLDILNEIMPIFQIRKVGVYRALKKHPICEAWLYEAILEASEKMNYKPCGEIKVDQMYNSNELEEKFTVLLAKMKRKEHSHSHLGCPICEELAIY